VTRVDPPFAADERTMLVAFLDYYRETMIAKIEGLDDAQAGWTPAPTANSLLGLINHLTYVEHWWFHECLLGKPPELPDVFGEDKDADFRPPADQPIGFTVDRYRQECTRSNEIVVATSSLDEISKNERVKKRGITLRWILVHMIEETARHAGHADITRELIDGATGD